MKIEELKSRDPITVGPETTLREVATISSSTASRALPVVGERGGAGGGVGGGHPPQGSAAPSRGTVGSSRGCSATATWTSGSSKPGTAGDAMTSPAITIGVDRDVSFAARSMTEYGIKRLPVVDDDGALVGIVTRADLVRAFARSDEEIEREIDETVLRTLWIEEPALEVRVENGEVRLSASSGADPTPSS